MADYIDREKLIESIKNDCHEQVYYTKEDAIDCIKSAISENVAPVVKARWTNHCCTACWKQAVTFTFLDGSAVYIETPRCPACGAMMNEEA